MDVQLLTMDKEAALAAYRQYQLAVKREHNDIDAGLARGYKALSQGKQLIDLHQVMQDAGVDHRGRPLLAIARADAQRCWFRNSFWECQFKIKQSVKPRERNYYIDIPREIFPPLADSWGVACTAIVPLIPPQYRPNRGIHNYHILWERVA